VRYGGRCIVPFTAGLLFVCNIFNFNFNNNGHQGDGLSKKQRSLPRQLTPDIVRDYYADEPTDDMPYRMLARRVLGNGLNDGSCRGRQISIVRNKKSQGGRKCRSGLYIRN